MFLKSLGIYNNVWDTEAVRYENTDMILYEVLTQWSMLIYMNKIYLYTDIMCVVILIQYGVRMEMDYGR